MDVYRTIFVLDVPFLDAYNFTEVEEAFKAYLSKVPESSKVAVDFESVQYISSVFAIILTSMEPGFKYRPLYMRLNPNVKEVFELLGFMALDKFDLIEEGNCPACNGLFNYTRYACQDCGKFDTVFFKWRFRE